MKSLIIFFVGIIVAAGAQAAEPRAVLPAPRKPVEIALAAHSELARDSVNRSSFVYRLRNAAALDVASAVNEQLRKALGSTPKHDGLVVDSPVVLIPEAASNSLIVVATTEYARKIKAMIQELDRPARRIMIQAKLTLVGPNGQKIVSRPQLMTMDGTKAVIEVSSDHGQKYQLELTPYVVESKDHD